MEIDQNKINSFLATCRKAATNTSPIDRLDAVEKLKALAKLLGHNPDTYLVAEGPTKANEIAKEMSDNDPEFEPFTDTWFGSISNYWIKTVRYAEANHEFKVGEHATLLDAYEAVADSCFCFFAWEKLWIIIDRPTILAFDDNHELHGENHPSIEFKDGTRVYSWHGVKVSEQIIMAPETITLQQIEKEENAEIKRIMIERFGVGRYLAELKAECVDMDTVPVIQGQSDITMRALLIDSEGRKFLCGTDGSTKRVYYMQVPKECKTCVEAGTALAGFDESKIVAVS